MENLAGISDLKFCQISQKINIFYFPSVYSVPMGEIGFPPLKPEKTMKN